MSDQILYGGDYNPEQWDRQVWDEDDAAFDLAGITTVTLGVFAWAHLQPAEDRYDFSRLDAIVDRARAQGRSIVLATPSGAMPPWLARAYPDACRVDFEGRRHVYGQRHNHCPSSTAFARLSVALAGRLAERYGGNPADRRVARRQRVRRRLLLRPVRGGVPGLAPRAVHHPRPPERRVEHHVLVAHLHRLGGDPAADRPVRALARTGPHRVPGHHPGLPPLHVGRAARRLPGREGGHPRARPAHPRHDEPHGPVPAGRLPPLGRAPRPGDVGQLPAAGPVAAPHGRPHGARARGDARAASRGAVLGDGADPVDDGQPRRQPREAPGRPAGCGPGSPWRTAPTRPCSSSCASRAARARSTTAPSSTTRAARTPGSSGRWPRSVRSWRAWGTRRSAPGRPHASRCCSTGTPGGRSSCPTGPTGTCATSTCSPATTGRCGTSTSWSTSSRSPPTSTGTTSSSRPCCTWSRATCRRGCGRWSSAAARS